VGIFPSDEVNDDLLYIDYWIPSVLLWKHTEQLNRYCNKHIGIKKSLKETLKNAENGKTEYLDQPDEMTFKKRYPNPTKPVTFPFWHSLRLTFILCLFRFKRGKCKPPKNLRWSVFLLFKRDEHYNKVKKENSFNILAFNHI
jgi:hypothetical protein